MRALLLVLSLCMTVMPALANPGGIPNGGVGKGHGKGNIKHEVAPAPLLGYGIPSALAIGGILLGAKLRGRVRR